MGVPNWSNRTLVIGDNLSIMRTMNSESVDLIYLDPPFNKNTVFSDAAGEFSDVFRNEDLKAEWLHTIREANAELYNYLNHIMGFDKVHNFAYLVFMAVRLLECHRILRRTGSIYLHCDSTMSHYLKLVMDAIFGLPRFRNEIIWSYKTLDNASKRFGRNCDSILFYAKTDDAVFNQIFTRRDKPVKQLVKQNVNGSAMPKRDENGQVMYRMTNHKKIGNVWEIPILMSASKERAGYPTQKPLEILERIIKASSNKGDMVLDPFCGSGTTCIAADRLDREWIGIDMSKDAVKLGYERLLEDSAGRRSFGRPFNLSIQSTL